MGSPMAARALPWSCHWEHISGSLYAENPSTPAVWICEYPYRTLRAEGPSEECAGCPVWEELVKARRRAGADRVSALERVPALPR
jgi:hypothetical protein